MKHNPSITCDKENREQWDKLADQQLLSKTLNRLFKLNHRELLESMIAEKTLELKNLKKVLVKNNKKSKNSIIEIMKLEKIDPKFKDWMESLKEKAIATGDVKDLAIVEIQREKGILVLKEDLIKYFIGEK